MGHTRCVTASGADALSPPLRCGIVLRSGEDACQVLAGAEVASVRFAAQFPAPRRERVLPGHLVAIAAAPDAGGQDAGGQDAGMVVWRWYDAVVLGSEAEFVQLWDRHEVAGPQLRTRRFQHPAAGLLTFTATEFDVPTSPDIRMVVHTPRDEQTWARLPLTRRPATSRAIG